MRVAVQLIVLVVSLGATLLFAADDLGPQPRSKKAAEMWLQKAWAITAEIPPLLDSQNPADQTLAVTKTRTLLAARLKFVTGAKGNVIIKKYLDTGKLEQLLELIDFGIAQHPEQTDELIILQRTKVAVLTQLKRQQDAIAAAKAYYNVASMAGTADAIQTMMVTLALNDAKNTGLADKFKTEQIQGAEGFSGSLTEARPITSVLASIKIDDKHLNEAIGTQAGTDWTSLLGKGNLLLLADRSAEAEATFNAALLIADSRSLAAASENVARAMRARDGSIGRANAYIESLRPKMSMKDEKESPKQAEVK